MEQKDFDMIKDFHNYVLSKEERSYHGVVIPRDIFETEELAEPIMIWTVSPFGWTCSNYFTLRILAQALELCIFDHTYTNHPYHWHYNQFDLSCTTGYDTILHRFGIISFDGEVVVRVIVLFDDGCVYRLGDKHVRYGLRKNFEGLQFFGNQEAARKRTSGGQRLQAWCGCCVYTDQN